MRSVHEHQGSNSESSTNRELKLLSEVEECPEMTQRDMAHRIGVALGITNVLLRNLSEKGYIRVTSAGWKRCIYSLTPKGVSRKLHLTLNYVKRVLNQYQNIRQNLKAQLEPLNLHAESCVAIYGTGEFAELVYLGLKDLGIDEIVIFNDNKTDQKFLGMPVSEIRTIRPENYDSILVATLDEPIQIQQNIAGHGLASDRFTVIFGDYSIRDSA